MKRVINLLCALFVILTGAFSCGNKDKNINLAEKEFKNYVQKTFDNPKALKEIVEIIPSDTLSIEKVKKLLLNTCNLCDSAVATARAQDSLQREVLNIDNLDRRKAQNADFSTKLRIMTIANSMISLVSESFQSKMAIELCKDAMKKCADSLKYEAPIYEYKIKYRVERDKDLKLETQYAYIDSLKGFLKIIPQTMTKDDYSEQMRDGFDKAKNALIEINKLSEICEKEMENIKEMQSFMLLHSK